MTEPALAIEPATDSHAFLVSDHGAAGARVKKKDVVTFTIARLKGHTPTAPRAALKGVKLTVWECDYDDAWKLDEKTTEPIAVLTLDLVPNKDLATNKDAPHWMVSGYVVEEVYHAFKYLARKKGDSIPPDAEREASAHFYLFLGAAKGGGVFVPLRIRPGENYHDEGEQYEVGMTLEHPSLDPRIDRRDHKATANALVAAVDTLQHSRQLATPPLGAMKKVLPAKDADGNPTLMGRFNDPKRNPSVHPLAAHVALEMITATALDGPDPVDVDGIHFMRFVHEKKRREFIEDLTKQLVAKVVPGDAEVTNQVSTADTEKAYFVIHEIASGLTGKAPPPFDSTAQRAKASAVNGWVNADGKYTVCYDLSAGMSGAVYAAVDQLGAKWALNYFVGFETVSVTTADELTDAELARYPTWGWGKSHREDRTKPTDEKGNYPTVTVNPAYFHYSSELLDTLVDLYVLASARCNHLLTVTCHVEIDRNMMYSGVYETYGAPALKARYADGKGSKVWVDLLSNPSNVHGDPYGFDPQVFYDRITARLIGLGATKWASRAPLLTAAHKDRKLRYGVNPNRIVEDKDTRVGPKTKRVYRRTRTNSSGDLLTFPWQSADPPFEKQKGGKQATPHWWKA
jgi:hypothetical protein